MAETSSMLTRQSLMALAAAAGPARAFAAPGRKVLTILGDSITAGYGLPAAAALPAQLQAALDELGAEVLVRPAGVSGDTTAGGLARLDFSVQADTDLCLVALGANDLLQGLDPASTRANLDQIVSRLKARKIAVVLAGIVAPPAMGQSFARDYSAIYPAVARSHGIVLYPNLLGGVAGIAALNQKDGIHPNAQGARIIAQRLAPILAKAMAARR
jgi:acyl-CoA thioesterase I